MQQLPPPQGRQFPDAPQQPKTPLFASNAPNAAAPVQGYEPQARMQHTGSVPVIQAPKYSTGQLRTLHSTMPVQQMPPQSAYPANPLQPAQAYQARHATPENIQQIPGTPLMVQTVQGVAVVVTAEEMEKALAEHARKNGKRKIRKQSGGQKKETKQEKKSRFAMKFSVTWLIFGLIGIVSSILWLLEWVIIPLLVYLNTLTGGAA
ncbi:MAG: hypothetical protein IKK57_09370 [Clostridia bacterium]|nr:hypothetical protein [Clostridia bacterium]